MLNVPFFILTRRFYLINKPSQVESIVESTLDPFIGLNRRHCFSLSSRTNDDSIYRIIRAEKISRIFAFARDQAGRGQLDLLLLEELPALHRDEITAQRAFHDSLGDDVTVVHRDRARVSRPAVHNHGRRSSVRVRGQNGVLADVHRWNVEFLEHQLQQFFALQPCVPRAFGHQDRMVFRESVKPLLVRVLRQPLEHVPILDHPVLH